MRHLSMFCSLMILIIFSLKSYPQDTIRYSYDNTGNRIGRKIIEFEGGGSLKSATIQKVIIDDTFKQSIKIYPNPTQGLVEIEIPEDPDSLEYFHLLVMDLSGRVIIDRRKESLRTTMDLGSQPNGIYILLIKKGQLVSQWKIIKK